MANAMRKAAVILVLALAATACSPRSEVEILHGASPDQLVSVELVLHHGVAWVVPGARCGSIDPARVTGVSMPDQFGPATERRLEAVRAHNRRVIARNGASLGCRFQPDFIALLYPPEGKGEPAPLRPTP